MERDAECVRLPLLILRRQLRGGGFVAVQFDTKILTAEGSLFGEYDVQECQIAIAGVLNLILNVNLHLRSLARNEADFARFLEKAISRG